MADFAISLKSVGKSFVEWRERPRSIKSILSQLVTFRLKLGTHVSKTVLEEISFDIKKGEFVGIMGRNGAGKSTLLKMMGGIYSPSKGSIETSGKLIPLLELGAGFAPELNGYENIFLNASIFGYSSNYINSKLNDIIEFSELGENLYKPVQNYSSGMLVRLGFSIAAHLDAEILLFDEILAVGDIGFQSKCLKKIKQLYSGGKTIILVTHSPQLIEQFCNRCIVFDNTGVIFDGDSKEGTGTYRRLFSEK